jgi:membrane-associated phospholipid phosphatase
MAVAVFAGLLATVYFHLQPVSRGRRILILSIALGLPLLESFALLYVGVHYLTDLLGALAISLAWLGVMRIFLLPAPTPIDRPVEK